MLTEKKVFKDSVLGYIEVTDEVIWKLIDTKEFQRLRRIRHLGGVSYVFHCAEHSRFSHSLGVYEITRRLLENVEGINLSDYERLLVLCSALLHDLGHGPLSHAFESVSSIHHEELSIRIIKENSEVNNVLNSFDSKLINDICEVLNKTHKNELIISIISSQIDADRLDYLLRDSFNTGVVYGITDLKRLFRTAKVIDNQICFKKSALKELEIYLLGRICMYENVYFHPTGRSFELLFQNALSRYLDLKRVNFRFKHKYTYLDCLSDSNISLEEFQGLDDYTIFHYMKLFENEDDLILNDLSIRFVNRKLYKHIEYFDEGDIASLQSEIESILVEEGFDPKYYLAKDTQKTSLYKESERILICDSNDITTIEESSEIISKANYIEKATFLFFPEEVIEKVNNLI